MAEYPNQKTIQIKKAKSDKNNPYMIINKSAMSCAMQNLTDKSFKMWCYLNSNQDNFMLQLSKVHALSFGISNKTAYDRAIAELIETGYLKNINDNFYIFYEKI